MTSPQVIKRISSQDIQEALEYELYDDIEVESSDDEFQLWVECLVQEGYDLSEYTWDEMYEIYENYDNYLLVMEHLLDENYASDVETANTLIENMSEDWLNDILEAKKWIQKAIKKKGALSKQLGVPEEENIPGKMLRGAAKKKGKLGKRARLALTLRKFK